jgi:small subunit ribosomal protein S18
MPMGFETRKRKTCRFCENRIDVIDYKEERLLRKFINERGKIVPRRISGNCAWHQRRLTTAVKRARHLALIPFTHEVYR